MIQITNDEKRTLVNIFKAYVASACFYVEEPIVKARIENPLNDASYIAVTVSNDRCSSPEKLIPGTRIQIVNGRLEFSINLDTFIRYASKNVL